MSSVMLTQDDTLDILRQTGAMHEGHFRLPTGSHTNLYFQMAQAHAMFNNWRRLCVGLSRVLRQASQIAPLLPNLTIVAPSSGGIAMAFGVRDALGVDQMVWAERNSKGLHFRQFASIKKGEKCVLVDDILLTGKTLRELADLVKSEGGVVVGSCVVVDARGSEVDLKGVPFFSLLKVSRKHYADSKSCPLCAEGTPLVEASF